MPKNTTIIGLGAISEVNLTNLPQQIRKWREILRAIQTMNDVNGQKEKADKNAGLSKGKSLLGGSATGGRM